jgi:hypothetical protein
MNTEVLGGVARIEPLLARRLFVGPTLSYGRGDPIGD